MIKILNLFKNTRSSSANIIFFIFKIAILLIISHIPISLKFNGNTPLLISIVYSLFVIGFYLTTIVLDTRSLEQITTKNTCIGVCIGLILIPKSTSVYDIAILITAINIIYVILYVKSNQLLKKITDNNDREHYLEVQWAKSKANSQNVLLYYLALIGGIHYLTLEVKPELAFLTYASMVYILLMLWLSFIKKFTPIANLRIVLFYVAVYAIQSVVESSKALEIEMVLPFVIGFVVVCSLFDSFSTILYTFKKDMFWKIYGALNKAFSEVIGRDNKDELYDFFYDINKNNAHICFDTIEHRIVFMSYKSYIFIEKHHYGKEKIIEAFNSKNLNFNRKFLEQLIQLSGKKIESFTNKEHKIAEQYSIRQVTAYIEANGINYSELNDDDFIVIDMMTI